MDVTDFELQRFLSIEWDYEPDGQEHMGYYSVTNNIQECATKKTESGDVDQVSMLDLLARATSMMMVPDSINDPFAPFMQGQTRRSTYTDDFTDDELNFFEVIVGSIKEPWVTARIADVLWLRRRNKDCALLAIDAYIARPICPDTWNRDEKDCWERAGRLCLLLRDQQRLAGINKALHRAFQLEYPECLYMHLWLAKLMDALAIDKEHLNEIANKLLLEGERNKAEQEFEAARSYIVLAEKKFQQLNDQAQKMKCQMLFAEAFKEQGDFRLAGSAMVANSFYNDAIHAYQRLPKKFKKANNIDSCIKELRKKLEETGIALLGQMVQVTSPGVDITEQQKQAKDHVSGKKTFNEAIQYFTGLIQVLPIKEYEDAARKSLQNAPIMAMMPSGHYALDGRLVAQVSGLNLNADDDSSENKLTMEYQKLKIFHHCVGNVVQSRVLPALHTILLEHRVNRGLIQSLCEQAPIVPEGRERLIASALWMGFEFDFSSAIHLLCPQVEHLVRTQLKAYGAITAKLENGIETENSLSSILKLEEATAVFGEDLVFELQALFSKVLGFNLRNEVSHGLLSDDAASSPASVYAWWLVLKLVIRSFHGQLAPVETT